MKIDKKEAKLQAAWRADRDAAEAAAESRRREKAEERYEAEREKIAIEAENAAKDKSHDPWKVVQVIEGMCPYQKRDGTPCQSREACAYHMYTMRNLNLQCPGFKATGCVCRNGMPCNEHLGPGMKGFVPGGYGEF